MNHEQAYNSTSENELMELLEEKYLQYNNPSFIECDPVSIPHRYSKRQDIEISGFLTSAISWGRRDLILRSAGKLMGMMGDSPYEYIMSANEKDLGRFSEFVHRTFNGHDCTYFLKGLRHIYTHFDSMETIVLLGMKRTGSLKEGLSALRRFFFEPEHQLRTEKHFADVERGAAGKRLNMFMRWMVRRDNRGVDFGIWRSIDPSVLYIPLDLHSGNSARYFGLLNRKINDWKAVEELTDHLKKFDPADPVKYDFALFGLGVNHHL